MNKLKNTEFFLLSCLTLATAPATVLPSNTLIAEAHSGRTDANGGHHDYKNKSGLGSYHYHCGGHPAHPSPKRCMPLRVQLPVIQFLFNCEIHFRKYRNHYHLRPDDFLLKSFRRRLLLSDISRSPDRDREQFPRPLSHIFTLPNVRRPERMRRF